MKIFLSVIMPVFNETFKEIHESISSILNQTFSSFEFIIVDDNPTSDALKDDLLNERKRDSRIRLIFNKTNIGPSKSTNRGILCSRGKLIARMDADDISLPSRFQKQIGFMNKYNLDFDCFNFSFINSNNELIKKDCYSNLSQINQYKIKKIMSYCSITNGPSFMFKRDVFDAVGGYRARWIEDYDFAARALVLKFRIGYQSDSLILKRERKDSITNCNALKQFLGLITISKYLRKYKFKKIISLKTISKDSCMFNKHDTHVLYDVKRNINNYKDEGSFLSLIIAILMMFCSKLVFNFYFWSKTLGGRYGQELLMKLY